MKNILESLEKLILSQVFKLTMQNNLKDIKKTIEELAKAEPSFTRFRF
jgi:hypothetical protein